MKKENKNRANEPFDPANYDDSEYSEDDFSMDTDLTEFVNEAQLIIKENDKRYRRWLKEKKKDEMGEPVEKKPPKANPKLLGAAKQNPPPKPERKQGNSRQKIVQQVDKPVQEMTDINLDDDMVVIQQEDQV